MCGGCDVKSVMQTGVEPLADVLRKAERISSNIASEATADAEAPKEDDEKPADEGGGHGTSKPDAETEESKRKRGANQDSTIERLTRCPT